MTAGRRGFISAAALSLTSQELQSAAATLDARILVARPQPKWMDRFRDPLVWFKP